MSTGQLRQIQVSPPADATCIILKLVSSQGHLDRVKINSLKDARYLRRDVKSEHCHCHCHCRNRGRFCYWSRKASTVPATAGTEDEICGWSRKVSTFTATVIFCSAPSIFISMLLLSDMPAKESTNLASVQTLDGAGRHANMFKSRNTFTVVIDPSFQLLARQCLNHST